jgi:pimeloyl-ACP methyl ester carboxylesterase
VLVLVHGAWHGAWCWDAVVRELSDRGVPAAAVELPLTAFRDDVATVRQAIEEAGEEVVVCAHSYGGMVVSTAAQGLHSVRHLVFLAAFQTAEGEDMATLLMREPSALTTALAIGPEGITVDRSRLHEVTRLDHDPLDLRGLHQGQCDLAWHAAVHGRTRRPGRGMGHRSFPVPDQTRRSRGPAGVPLLSSGSLGQGPQLPPEHLPARVTR